MLDGETSVMEDLVNVSMSGPSRLLKVQLVELDELVRKRNAIKHKNYHQPYIFLVKCF